MSRSATRYREFAEQYIIDFNAAKAAIRVGYSVRTAKAQGWNLLQIPEVQGYLQEALRKRMEWTHITQDRVLQELAAVAFFDPRKLFNADGSPKPINALDNATAAGIGGIEVQEVYSGTGADRAFAGYVKRYKLVDKNPALGNAMKHLGMLKESLSVTGPNEGPVELSVAHSITAALSAAIKDRLRGK